MSLKSIQGWHFHCKYAEGQGRESMPFRFEWETLGLRVNFGKQCGSKCKCVTAADSERRIQILRWEGRPILAQLSAHRRLARLKLYGGRPGASRDLMPPGCSARSIYYFKVKDGSEILINSHFYFIFLFSSEPKFKRKSTK
jgi:hypothetical protein